MKIDFQTVADTIEKSPQNIKDIIFSVEVGDKVAEIAEINNLEIDTYPLIVDEIGYVILGLKSRKNFLDSLSEIGVKKDTAIKIEEEIDKYVFSKLNNTNSDKITEIENKNGDNIHTTVSPKLDKTIESRVSEIAVKYSLNIEQTDILSNEVAKSLDNQKISIESLMNKLGVSSLIAEQIFNDLNDRIFNSSIKLTKAVPTKSSTDISNTGQDVQTNSDNIHKNNSSIAQTPNYTPRPKVVIDDEPIQTPIPVPRFKAVPMSDIESGQDFMPKVAPKPNVGGIMQNKLNTVTEKAPTRPPVPEKYSVDPYREPLN